MAYIKSNAIHVYPCGNRGDNVDNDLSRLQTEYNLISIVNKLVDRNSFVVTDGTFNGNSEDEFVFNINGYLFRTTVNNIVSSAKDIVQFTEGKGEYIYAGIAVGMVKLPYSDTYSIYQELLPQKAPDVSGNVNAITNATLLDDTADTEGNNYFNGVKFITTQGDIVGYTHDTDDKEGKRTNTEGDIDFNAVQMHWGLSDTSGSIFNNFNPASENYQSVQLYILPILQNVGDNTYKVPMESLVKFSTNKLGTNRSVTIDDGELN